MKNRISQHLENKEVNDDLFSVPQSPMVRIKSFEEVVTDGSLVLALDALEVARDHIQSLRSDMVRFECDCMDPEVLDEFAYISDHVLHRSDRDED